MDLGETRLSDAQLVTAINFARVLAAQWGNDNMASAIRMMGELFPGYVNRQVSDFPARQHSRYIYGETSSNRFLLLSGAESGRQLGNLLGDPFGRWYPERPYHESWTFGLGGDRIMADVRRAQNVNRPWIIVGHSMGGGLAQEIAANLRRTQGDNAVQLLVTFGAPKVGDGTFVTALGRIPRIIIANRDDPVPCLPPDQALTDEIVRETAADRGGPDTAGRQLIRFLNQFRALDLRDYGEFWVVYRFVPEQIVMLTTGRISQARTPQIYGTNAEGQILQTLLLLPGASTTAHSIPEYARRLQLLRRARTDAAIQAFAGTFPLQDTAAIFRVFGSISTIGAPPRQSVFSESLSFTNRLRLEADLQQWFLESSNIGQRTNVSLSWFSPITPEALRALLLAIPEAQPPLAEVSQQSAVPATIVPTLAESVAGAGPSYASTGRSTVLIPKDLLAQVSRLSTTNYAVVWINEVVANAQSKGQAKTIAKYINSWLKRMGNAASVDGGRLQGSLLAFLTAAPSQTVPAYPVQ